MTPLDKRQIRADWKDRKLDAGIYALRFRAGTWIGKAPRLGAIENRHRFAFSTGGERNPEMAAAFAAEGDYAFEVLEALDPKLSPMSRDRILKERLAHWLDALGARPV